MTRKKKITIAVSVIVAAVMIFAIVMFSIWASVEVYVKKVDYNTLQKKLSDYYIVPTGLDEEIDGVCRVSFPRAEENSNHRYGKYTNLTIRYKYATGYDINVKKDDLSGSIYATKVEEWEEENKFIGSLEEILAGYESANIDGIDIYYKQIIGEANSIYSSSSLEITYIRDLVIYSAKAAGKFGNEEQINEYAKYLFNKVLVF